MAAADYSKLTLYEQIMLRTETYLGSKEQVKGPQWLVGTQGDWKYQESMKYTPAFLKMFDEIAVNAADNTVRHDNTKNIRFVFDKENHTISVYNDGTVPPIQKHPVHKSYVPSMIFGELLTSNNYNDNEERTTGGRNGFGAKLTNMFSTRFTVDMVSGPDNREFHQTWTGNMQHTEGPTTKYKKAQNSWIKVTWTPDTAKLNMPQGITEDVWALLKRRVYDIAGTTHKKVRVFLDNELVPIKSFGDYAKAMCPNATAVDLHPRWEVAIAMRPEDTDVSAPTFVNNIRTNRGGTHVATATGELFKYIQDTIQKKLKTKKKLRPADLRNQCWIFVNARIVNPVFGGQQKDELTSKASSLGSKPQWSAKQLKKACSNLMGPLLEWATLKTSAALSKSVGSARKSRLHIPKLNDANKAGTSESNKCTLIVTEGDSAASSAVAGLSVVGRNYYGVFPLRGKMLNVRQATTQQVIDNKEVQNVFRILGLTPGREPTQMRYGSIMIMCDQDVDGSHIKGLIINLIDYYFRSLLKKPGFIKIFQTPIVKVTRGSQSQMFFSLPEYEQWAAANPTGWRAKYYKGLGTSTAAEAKDYFRNLKRHVIPYEYAGDSKDKIDMAFNEKRVSERKVCTENVPEDAGMVTPRDPSTFIMKELILFWDYANVRGIPSVVDGFKPSQRKVLFACMKRRGNEEVKVAQLMAYTAEKSDYHHGEVSLGETIINMAQNYPGSNNINTLVPCGQFGTRLLGGKDKAASRYIFTKLCDWTPKIFDARDTPLLHKQMDENNKFEIEPKFYAPILPMVLINGADGMGVGWSTTIPMYSPEAIIQSIRQYLVDGSLPDDLLPSVKGFTGTIRKEGNRVLYEGIITRVGLSKKYRVTELPVRKWTQTYKDDMLSKDWIKHIHDESTETSVNMLIEVQDPLPEGTDLLKKFKLRTSMTLTNMVAHTAEGAIRRFAGPVDILAYWLPRRLALYEQRRDHLIRAYEQELATKNRKASFIAAVLDRSLRLDDPNLQQVVLERFGGDESLLDMSFRSCTQSRVSALRADIEKTEEAVRALQGSTAKQLWLNDLEGIETIRGTKRKH